MTKKEYCKNNPGIDDRLLDILPHGSGINFDYEIEQKSKRIYIRNAWDYMDEYGLCDDIFPFVVCYENGRGSPPLTRERP